MEHLEIAAAISLALFSIFAAVDGIYLHLWKYRLHTRPESVFEHKLHTLRAFMFIPTLYLLFVNNSAGIALWLGLLFVLIGFVVEFWDVLSENESRKELGGLSSFEYALHVAITIFQVLALAFLFASKPLAAWSLDTGVLLPTNLTSFLKLTGTNTLIGTIAMAGLHIWLLRPKYRQGNRLIVVQTCC